jgi:hypothetical protein
MPWAGPDARGTRSRAAPVSRRHRLLISRRVGGIALSALLFAGCQQLQQLTGPNTVIPADVRSSQTAAQVTQRMLDQIAANEKKLGRSLAPARIIRVQLLHQGEPYQFKRLDGTDAAIEASADNGPGWVVEAVGTFVGVDIGTSQIDSLGTHGFELGPMMVRSRGPSFRAGPVRGQRPTTSRKVSAAVRALRG